MTTYYVDFVNGNDSNNGTSFAQRKLTLSSVTALCSPGDTVRVCQSPSSYATGTNGTFTNQSMTITESAASTTLIASCDSAWTPSTNVTASALSTTAANIKEGTAYASIAIAAGFTTGMAAYFATGTLDLSAYQQISFWIQPNAAVASGVLRMDLCSDTAGATPVYSFTITKALAANQNYRMTIDNGSVMSSATAIQSVALYCISDPGTVTVILDNIFAAKAPGAGYNLQTLIGKGDGFWYPIRSVNGTTIKLDGSPFGIAQSAVRGYSGTTATVALYAKPVIMVTNSSGAFQTFSTSGSNGSQITISGGWDSSAMSTQVEDTFLMGWENATSAMNWNSKAFVTLTKIGIAWFNNTFGTASGGTVAGNVMDHCSVIGCVNNATSVDLTDSCIFIGGNFQMAILFQVKNSYFLSGNGNALLVSNSFSSSVFIPGFVKDCIFKNCGGGLSISGVLNTPLLLSNITANENVGAGVDIASSSNVRITNITCLNNTVGGLSVTGAASVGNKVFNLTTSGNTTYGVRVVSGGDIYLYNASIAESTAINLNNSIGRVYSEAEGGATGTLKIYTLQGTILTNTTNAKSGKCWAMPWTRGTLDPALVPQTLKFGPFLSLAGVARTVGFWAARTNSNLSGQLRIMGGIYPGVGSVGSDITVALTPTANATVGPSDYSFYTITWTSTYDTAVEINVDWWSTNGTTTYIGYIDGPVVQ